MSKLPKRIGLVQNALGQFAIWSEEDPDQTVVAIYVRERNVFRNCDEKDWSWLFDRLDDSGHGKFWRAVFMGVRELPKRLPTEETPEWDAMVDSAARVLFSRHAPQVLGWDNLMEESQEEMREDVKAVLRDVLT